MSKKKEYIKENVKKNVNNTAIYFWEFLASENKWGIIISLTVGVGGCVFSHFWASLQLVSLILQFLTISTISFIFICIITLYHRKIIESSTEVALQKIEDKYIESTTRVALDKIEEKYIRISCNSNNLFKLFQLNDGGNFYNVAHNIFFNMLIESYSKNGENRRYYFPIDTYYEVIKKFICIGYKIKIINGVLLPFWYVPKEKDKALIEYTKFCKENAKLYERVTYYQDYNDKDYNWKDNTVKMIYFDLLYSEKSDDFAVRWLIELIAKIKELNEKFGKIIAKKLCIEEIKEDHDYFQYDDNKFIEAIKDNILEVENFLDQKYDNTTISCKMTKIINDLFSKDMNGKNEFIKKSSIQAKFDKDEINFEDVTEVGYFYKEKDGKECDQFVMFLNGSNTGPSVEIEIVTEKEKITKIQKVLSGLIKKD